MGLVGQVKACVRLAGAFGTPFIMYVESDKEWFFGPPLSAFVDRAPDGDEVGVVLAARDATSFETFPPMQRFTEGVINRLCGDLIAPGDYSYGPFLMNRALLPHVAGLQESVGWGWRHSVFREAHRRGLRVLHVVGNYPCPVEDRVEDASERTHRLRQLSQNILGLID
jgi:hypothetical protein